MYLLDYYGRESDLLSPVELFVVVLVVVLWALKIHHKNMNGDY